MTDLRDKIAAVQREHRLVTRMVGRKAEKSCLCGWRSPERDCTFTDHPDHLADAVIRELGLGKEFGCGFSDSRHGCRCSHRYVTEWEETEKWQEF